ncbi:ferric reductase-like transmembrane domain-containing protein [Blastomonas sp.]|uniref:ferric reductase-like transmembrane domain-containing protein n=1 Tax=Blastomonas sp. TaxID=1909299 RepID=UPI00260781F5|nr:ferric reductase-like transmembrane domain-containing protein [Blastomonas sp.]MDM7956869.1 ferric reductase-like transmembrane domain-containing protein [Blastomonas sp.]
MLRILKNPRLIWLVLAIPGIAMVAGFVRDPVTAFDLIHPSGEYSVRLMIVAMMISPLRAVLGRRSWLDWLLAHRRALGVAAFGYGALHLAFYLYDMGDWGMIAEEAVIFSIWTGYAAMLIFAAMAATSNAASQRMLKANWKRLQRLVYPAAVLIALHWLYVDGEWEAMLAHFVPLLVLEIIRVVLMLKRRSARRAKHAMVN